MSRFEERWSLYLVPVLLAWVVYGVLEQKKPTIEELAQRFCAGRVYETSGSWLDFVDTNWISLDQTPLGPRLVTDGRTGFSGDRFLWDKLVHCRTKVTHLDDGLLLEQLCDVVFVVSPDWKIRAIMDEVTWRARGKEILGQIREELRKGSGLPASPSPAERRPGSS